LIFSNLTYLIINYNVQEMEQMHIKRHYFTANLVMLCYDLHKIGNLNIASIECIQRLFLNPVLAVLPFLHSS
jgi:hypothetical protein